MQTDSLANYMFMSKFIKNNQKDIQMEGGKQIGTTIYELFSKDTFYICYMKNILKESDLKDIATDVSLMALNTSISPYNKRIIDTYMRYNIRSNISTEVDDNQPIILVIKTKNIKFLKKILLNYANALSVLNSPTFAVSQNNILWTTTNVGLFKIDNVFILFSQVNYKEKLIFLLNFIQPYLKGLDVNKGAMSNLPLPYINEFKAIDNGIFACDLMPNTSPPTYRLYIKAYDIQTISDILQFLINFIFK